MGVGYSLPDLEVASACVRMVATIQKKQRKRAVPKPCIGRPAVKNVAAEASNPFRFVFFCLLFVVCCCLLFVVCWLLLFVVVVCCCLLFVVVVSPLLSLKTVAT